MATAMVWVSLGGADIILYDNWHRGATATLAVIGRIILFERFSERARRLIFFARFAASQRGSMEIEPRDLFWGATHDSHRVGCPFAGLRDKRDEIRAILISEAKPAISMETNIPLSSSGKLSLTYGADEAEREQSRVIGIEHLLLGVLRTGDEALVRLAVAGYTLLTLRNALQEAQRIELEKPALWGECGCGRKEPPKPPDASHMRILKRNP
jgi:hypothetical protein